MKKHIKKHIINFIKFAGFFLIWALLIPIFPDLPTSNPAIQRCWLEVVPLFVIIALTLIFTKIIEKSKFSIPIFKKFEKNLLIGIGVSVFWLGISLIVLGFGKVAVFEGTNNVQHIYIWIFAVFLNAIMQELLVRGYLYYLIKSQYNTLIAALLTTILFTILHGGAFESGIIAVLNVFTMSIFMTVLMEYTETLLAPIIAHFLWNAVGCIIFGVVSLSSDYPNIINLNFRGATWLSGGAFKIEGSAIVFVMNIVLIIVFTYLNRKKKANEHS